MFQLLLLLAVPLLISHANTQGIPLRPWHSLALPTSVIIGATSAFFWGKWCLVFFGTTSLLVRNFSIKWAPFLWLLVAGVTLSGGTYLYHSHQHEKYAALLTEKPQTVHAIVSDISPWHTKKKGVIVTLEVTHIAYEPAPYRLRCYVYSPPQLSVGSMVCMYGVQTKKNNDKPHLAAYALRDRIIGSFFSPFLRFRKLQTCPPSYQWYQQWHAARSNLYGQLKSQLPEKTFLYFSALFLGNKNVPDYAATRRLFAAWGLTHYLARSGLHIALIIMLWSMLFLAVPLPFSLKQILLLLLLLGYSLISWGSISFARALVLWVCYISASLLRRNPEPLHLISLVAFSVVLLSPAYLFCLDFQLSFFLSGFLMLINHSKKRQFLLASCAT